MTSDSDKILKLIAEGYYRTSMQDEFIVCENPDFTPDSGENPNLLYNINTRKIT